uniref:Uncharacterized protein n=1 Tax=Triticum urartu TaxID=4572 RepID=A0A8R7UJB1_TRIUA
LLVVVSGHHVVVGTSGVVGVVVDGGVWLLGSNIWLLWQERVVVNTVVVLGSSGVGLGVRREGLGSSWSSRDRGRRGSKEAVGGGRGRVRRRSRGGGAPGSDERRRR